MSKRPYTSVNGYFLIPFILWVIIGATLLMKFDQRTLFAAVNTHYTPFFDKLMYWATGVGEGAVIITILVTLFKVPSLRNWWYFFTALFCNLIPAFIQQGLKHYFASPRPLNVYHGQGWVHVADGWLHLYANSFPSGHTTGAFSLFCFLSMLLPKRYNKFGLLFFFLALLVGYSRMYLAAHFFADVYAGSIIGTTTTFMVFVVMVRYQHVFFKRKHSLTTTNS